MEKTKFKQTLHTTNSYAPQFDTRFSVESLNYNVYDSSGNMCFAKTTPEHGRDDAERDSLKFSKKSPLEDEL
jgi:hypothetical protein